MQEPNQMSSTHSATTFPAALQETKLQLQQPRNPGCVADAFHPTTLLPAAKSFQFEIPPLKSNSIPPVQHMKVVLLEGNYFMHRTRTAWNSETLTVSLVVI